MRNGNAYGGEPAVDAQENEIVVGDGGKWAKGSTFFCKQFKLPGNWFLGKYSSINTGVIGNTSGLIALSGNVDSDDILNVPFIAAAGEAKVFFEDAVDVDVSGDTQIYMHGRIRVQIDNTGAKTLTDRWGRTKRYNTNILFGNKQTGDSKWFDESSTPDLETCPAIIMHGNPAVEFLGQPIFSMRNCAALYLSDNAAIRATNDSFAIFLNQSRLKMDDYSGLCMENGSMIRMTGITGAVSGEAGPCISPAFVMDSGSTFIMQGKTNMEEKNFESPKSPILIADQTQLLYLGQHGLGRKASEYETNTDMKLEARVESMSAAVKIAGDTNWAGSIGIATAEDFQKDNSSTTENVTNHGREYQINLRREPLLKVGSGAHIVADGYGESYIHIGPESGGVIRAAIDPAKNALLDIKLSPNADGRICYILNGQDVFVQHENKIHTELHDNSKIIMRGKARESQFDTSDREVEPWNDYRAAYGSTSSTHLNKDWSRPMTACDNSPTLQMYDESNFIMRGTWKYDESKKPEGWKDHPDKTEGNPLFECYENAEVRIGSATIKADGEGIEINGIKFTNDQLQKLLDLVKD